MESWYPPIAPEEIRTLLAPWPAAMRVYEDVVSWYGSNLFLRRRQKPGETYSNVDLPVSEIALGNPCNFWAKIFWDDDRAPSLMHELLHLKLWSEGFPIVVCPYVVDSADHLQFAIIKDFGNAIAHANFHRDFSDAGFSPKFFYNRDSVGFDPESERARFESGDLANSDLGYVRRTLWSAKYLLRRIEETYDGGGSTDARKIELIGVEMFPETMADDVQKISDWVEGRHYLGGPDLPASISKILRVIDFSLLFGVFSIYRDGSDIRGRRIEIKESSEA